MKKILIFLSIIYLSLCKECFLITKPKSGKDCHHGKTDSEDKECCYFYSTGYFYGIKADRHWCVEIPKNKTLEEFKSLNEEPYKHHKHTSLNIVKLQCQGRTYPEEA